MNYSNINIKPALRWSFWLRRFRKGNGKWNKVTQSVELATDETLRKLYTPASGTRTWPKILNVLVWREFPVKFFSAGGKFVRCRVNTALSWLVLSCLCRTLPNALRRLLGQVRNISTEWQLLLSPNGDINKWEKGFGMTDNTNSELKYPGKFINNRGEEVNNTITRYRLLTLYNQPMIL